jgi:GNAT superfamily N-acetyltransferase
MDAVTDRALVRTWTLDASVFAHVLAEREPSWRSEVHEIAGGRLVLCGAGLYVNRLIGAGIEAPLTDDDVDAVVGRSQAVGVEAAVEVTPLTHPASLAVLRARGFAHDPASDVTASARQLPGDAIDAPADIEVRPVTTPEALAMWQETSARGWGHDHETARQAADAFARVAYVVDGDGMVIAYDTADGEPVGCASTTIRNGVATVGGMSTVPAQRRRGVQAALLAFRLRHASERGCTLAASTAATGGASERNLIRHGFIGRFVVETHRLR